MLPCMRGIHEDMLLFGHESESTLSFSLFILHNKRAGPIGYSHYNTSAMPRILGERERPHWLWPESHTPCRVFYDSRLNTALN